LPIALAKERERVCVCELAPTNQSKQTGVGSHAGCPRSRHAAKHWSQKHITLAKGHQASRTPVCAQLH